MPREAFDPASYATKSPAMQAMQQRILDANGLHVVTPEYNGSFPGVLKYFIDMLKFPESFQSKPVAFTGEAMGIWGGLRSVEQPPGDLLLPQRPPLPRPRLHPHRSHLKLSPDGKITDADIAFVRSRKQAAGVRHVNSLIAK